MPLARVGMNESVSLMMKSNDVPTANQKVEFSSVSDICFRADL